MHIADFLWVLLKLYAVVIFLLMAVAFALGIAKAIAAVRQKITAPPHPIESACSRSLSS